MNFAQETAEQLHRLGYRAIPSKDNKAIAKFGNGEFYAPEDELWGKARTVSIALDNLILVDFDGNKGAAISPDEFAEHFGIDQNTMEAACFQWNREQDSLHYLFQWPVTFDRDLFYCSRDGVLTINGRRGVDLKTGNQLVHLKPHKAYKSIEPSSLPFAPKSLVEFFRKPVSTYKPTEAPTNRLTSGGGTPYGLSALRGICETVRSVPEGNRNAELNKQACAMGSLIAGGELEEHAARAELEAAAYAVGLKRAEINKTITSGMKTGKGSPRMAPNTVESNVIFLQGEQEVEWPELSPLNTDLSPVLPITPKMLPAEIRDWLVDICERMDNAPFEYAAVSAVVAMGSLIGRKVGIHPKKLDDWCVIPNVWGALIGRPSMKKTPVAKEVMKPLNDLEQEARKRYKADMEKFQTDIKIDAVLSKEAEKRAAAMIKKQDIDGARLLLADSANTVPERPIARRYTVNDATVEKLGVILEENPQGVLLFRDELSGWLLGLNREDRQSERAFYLEAWNGDGTFSYDRIGREDVFIKSTTTAVLGGIQPGRLLPVLSGQAEGAGDDGLVERLQLAVYPDKPLFKYEDRAPNEWAASRARAVFDRLDSIPFDMDRRMPALRFAPDAQERFSQWYVEINEYLGRDGITPIIESHIGKFPALIPALALIFHVVDNGHETPVSLEALEKAIEWGNVLKTHAVRVYGLADDLLAGARILAERLPELPNPFKKRHITTKHWTLLNEGKDIDRAIGVLEKHGYLVKVSTPSKGGRPSVCYRINPKAMEE